MMRPKLAVLFFSFLLFTGSSIFCQTDTTGKQLSQDSLSAPPNNPGNNPADEEFNLFLFTLLLVAISAMIGAAIIGAFAATSLLFLLIAFISVGILSVSLLAGLYKRSVTAGFKTFLYIICPLTGMLIGMSGFWIAARLLTISIANKTGLLAGATGGILGGIVMAFALSKTVVGVTRFFWKKFN
jgi:hypothetical protein